VVRIDDISNYRVEFQRFLVSEYCTGPNLSQELKNGVQLPEKELLNKFT
jgi:hypothetical protein